MTLSHCAHVWRVVMTLIAWHCWVWGAAGAELGATDAGAVSDALTPSQPQVCVVQIMASGTVLSGFVNNPTDPTIAVLVPPATATNVPVSCQDLTSIGLGVANQEPAPVNAQITVFTHQGTSLCTRGPFTLPENGARGVVFGSDCVEAQPGMIKVAVFDDEGSSFAQNLAGVLNTDPEVQASAVSRKTVESGGLAGFDCVATRLLGPPEADRPTAATVLALQAFVAEDGSYIGEWWGAGAALSGAAPSFDFDFFIPARFLGLFSGLASDGYFVKTGNPITVVQDHPVVQGLPDIFSAGGGTEFFVRAVPPFDSRLTILATYNGHGGTNPAIMVGQTGSSNEVLLFFDAIDNPGNIDLKQLWLNSVKFACTPHK
jgi:hypothetical protein